GRSRRRPRGGPRPGLRPAPASARRSRARGGPERRLRAPARASASSVVLGWGPAAADDPHAPTVINTATATTTDPDLAVAFAAGPDLTGPDLAEAPDRAAEAVLDAAPVLEIAQGSIAPVGHWPDQHAKLEVRVLA